jgi:hypothetical protein
MFVAHSLSDAIGNPKKIIVIVPKFQHIAVNSPRRTTYMQSSNLTCVTSHSQRYQSTISPKQKFLTMQSKVVILAQLSR